MFNLFSLDALQLTKYINSRFSKKIVKSDINEIRDLSFQILGNKEAFSSDSKSLMKIYYTLVRAYHNGILDSKISKAFPYKHNYYKNYINNVSTDYDPSNEAKGAPIALASESQPDLKDDSDKVVDSCCEYLNKSAKNIILDSFGPKFINTFNSFLNNVKDDDTALFSLCLKLLIEFWTKNTLDSDMINLIKDQLVSQAVEINRSISGVYAFFLLTNADSAKIPIDNVIEAYLLLLMANCYNEETLNGFVKLVSDNFNLITPQQKLKVFYSLSGLPENHSLTPILSRFLIYFHRNVNLLKLSDVILLVNSYRKLCYQNKVLDKIVELHLIPKFNNITIIDLLIILDSFAQLDYRCSVFTKNIDKEYLKGLKEQDQMILTDKLNQLYPNTTMYNSV